MDYQFKMATTAEDLQKIEKLAKIVWHSAYDSIIGEAQVDYMLEKFQSASAIEQDIKENHYEYLMSMQGDTLLGYCGVKPEPPTSVFLSKVYINPAFQHRGIAKALIRSFYEKYAADGYTRMHLTVNKNNASAIVAYERLGFQKYATAVTPIGNDFVMDDDLMELEIRKDNIPF